MKLNKNIKCFFAGDLFISNRLSDLDVRRISPIAVFAKSHDCRFGNLETALLPVNSGSPAMFPGGGYAMADPKCAVDIRRLGFNLLNAATNHAMDYGEGGCIETIKALHSAKLSFTGLGHDLESASAPAYLKTKAGIVSMLGVTSSFHDSYAAGPSNSDVIGRPGVSPLRHKALYHLPENDYRILARIASECGINYYHDIGRKYGYLPKEDKLKFGTFDFVIGHEAGVETHPLKADMDRTIKQILLAKENSDFVIVSCHSHQFKGTDNAIPPDFVSEFSHSCIDIGADIVVCHGPHILRGIEIYKGGLVLHGLGNFIFQNEQQKVLPEEFYLKYGLTRQSCNGPQDAFRARSKNGTVGIIASEKEWKGAVFSVTAGLDFFYVEARPIVINKIDGLPAFTEDIGVLQMLCDLSTQFGTDLEIDSNNVIASLKVAR